MTPSGTDVHGGRKPADIRHGLMSRIRIDILSNCRQYPKDEAPAVYKDFGEVLRSIEQAGLARTVAKLKARFVIKDSSEDDD
jgi:RNA-splicing ligase RtcB